MEQRLLPLAGGNEAVAAAGFVDILRADHHPLGILDGAVGEGGGIAAYHADRLDLGDVFRHRQQLGDRLERLPAVVHVETGHDHPLAHIGQLRAYANQLAVEKLRLVDAHHMAFQRAFPDLLRAFHHLGGDLGFGVGNNVVFAVAGIDFRLEDGHLLAGDGGALETADQLFRLAAEHAAADHFDPSDVALNDGEHGAGYPFLWLFC